MAAPLPAGVSLQALPVAPSINPMLGVSSIDPSANQQKGIDFAGAFSRIGQLRSKVELEDAQRKAEMAKAKAMLLEADLMERDLETQRAIALDKARQETENLRIAGEAAQFNLDVARREAARTAKIREAALAQLEAPGAPAAVLPSPLADVSPEDVVTAPPAATPTVVPPFKKTHDFSAWIRTPMAVEILNTGAPVSPAALGKKLGVERKTRTFIDPTTKSEYEVDIQEGPAGEIFSVLSAPRFVKVSPLQADVDKKTSDDISDFNTGGREKAVAQIAKLDEAINALRDPGTIGASGPIVGIVPEKLRAPFTTDRSLAIKKDIRQVIQTSLRAILGSQFTEKEGERMLDAAFSESLSEEANAARIEVLKKELQALLSAKSAQVDYFREHGTLAGFTPSIAPVPAAGVDLDANLPRNAPLSTVSTGGGNEIRVDPRTGKRYQKINGVVTEIGL